MKHNIPGEIAVAAKDDSTTLSPNKSHHLCGHQSENRTWEIAKELGIALTKGPMEVCNHVLLQKQSRKVPLVNQQNAAKVLPTMKKSTQTYLLYTVPTRNVPIRMFGISWWTVLQGMILTVFIRPMAVSLNQCAGNSKNGRTMEKRLKLFGKIMQAKTNFLKKEQAVQIGNLAQNLNTLLELPQSITA